MPISIDQSLGILPRALQLGSQRAEILASNLANADTPGYKARDIDFSAALSRTQGGTLALETASPGQMQPPAAQSGASLMYRIPIQPTVDGNTVDAQGQYAEFGRNGLQYEASLTFLTDRIKTLITAITGN
ncbi:MAG: flagellar basal body rod protein FlgB [Gammaproteobacteria bacterium]|nr:flagellar basal body rod protein FlgB [Gammaproteobacteria bacterium]